MRAVVSEISDIRHTGVMAIPRMPAARNALRVLTLLAEHTGPVRAATIARSLHLPRSSVYQLLAVMRDEGFLIHYPEPGAWGPSSRVHDIGTMALATTRLDRLGQPILDRLVAASPIPATAHLAVLAGLDVQYAGRGAGARSPMTVSFVGVRLPALSTATGRAVIAALSDAQQRALLPTSELVARAGGPTRRQTLTREMRENRARGWAREYGDVDPSYGSVAAAAADASGYPAAAVGLTFRLADLGDELAGWDALGALVREHAEMLTERLGGRPRPKGRAS